MRSAIEEAGATLATHENWRSAVEEAEATLGQKLRTRSQTSKPGGMTELVIVTVGLEGSSLATASSFSLVCEVVGSAYWRSASSWSWRDAEPAPKLTQFLHIGGDTLAKHHASQPGPTSSAQREHCTRRLGHFPQSLHFLRPMPRHHRSSNFSLS